MNDAVKRNISKAVLLAVASSQIAAIGYTETDQVLTIQFPSKGDKPAGVYQYANFPLEKFNEFQAAESKGKFFGANIKSSPDAHPYVRLTEAEVAEHITLPVVAEHSADDPGMVNGGINVAEELQEKIAA